MWIVTASGVTISALDSAELCFNEMFGESNARTLLSSLSGDFYRVCQLHVLAAKTNPVWIDRNTGNGKLGKCINLEGTGENSRQIKCLFKMWLFMEIEENNRKLYLHPKVLFTKCITWTFHQKSDEIEIFWGLCDAEVSSFSQSHNNDVQNLFVTGKRTRTFVDTADRCTYWIRMSRCKKALYTTRKEITYFV